MKKLILIILAILVALAGLGVFFIVKELSYVPDDVYVARIAELLSCKPGDTIPEYEQPPDWIWESPKIEKELDEMKIIYKSKFKQPIPVCEQCSNLELSLILEKAIQTNSAVTHIEKKNDDSLIRDDLKKATIEYKEKFKRPAPWWWICSDEERLKRLKNALKANVKYRDYSKINRDKSYEFGKTIAKYEMEFKKLPPEWDCSDEEYIWRLQKELGMPSPYVTEQERVELEAKLKTEYEKKFGTPITDFELSITQVYREYSAFLSRSSRSVFIARTATGMLVKSKHNDKEREKEFGIGEWLDFVHALYKCRINEWDNEWKKEYKRKHPRGVLDGTRWGFRVYFQDRDSFKFSGVDGFYPPTWEELSKAIGALKMDDNTELEEKLKTEYEKRFGSPISDFELSISNLSFFISRSHSRISANIVAARTNNGAFVRLKSKDEEVCSSNRYIELSIEEWLDFIRAIYECRIDKWEEKYEIADYNYDEDVGYMYMHWSLYVNNILESSGATEYPPNWKEFIKVMHGMKTRIEKEGTICYTGISPYCPKIVTDYKTYYRKAK